MTRFTRVNVSIAHFPEATLISAHPLNLRFIVVFPGCLLVQLENMQMSVDQITSPYYFPSQHTCLGLFHIEMYASVLWLQPLTATAMIKREVCTFNSTNSHQLDSPAQTHVIV